MLYFFIILLIITFTYKLFGWFLHYLRIGEICNKYVLVTGCDSGFGQALALRLDALGFHVYAGCLTQNGCLFLSEKCSNRLITFTLDVTKPESIKSALNLITIDLPSYLGLWALVNNAGVLGPMGCLELCSLDYYHKVFNVNLYGTIEMTRHFLPLIRKSENGRVIIMSSILGRFAFSGAPYTFSKHGLEAYSDILRREVHNQNIKISIVEPSGFRTNLMQVEQMTEEMHKSYEKADADVQAVYGKDYVEKYKIKMSKISRASSPNLDPVLDALVHAITAVFPQSRYLVGSNSAFMTAVAYLPDWITDWILRKTSV